MANPSKNRGEIDDFCYLSQNVEKTLSGWGISKLRKSKLFKHVKYLIKLVSGHNPVFRRSSPQSLLDLVLLALLAFAHSEPARLVRI